MTKPLKILIHRLSLSNYGMDTRVIVQSRFGTDTYYRGTVRDFVEATDENFPDLGIDDFILISIAVAGATSKDFHILVKIMQNPLI